MCCGNALGVCPAAHGYCRCGAGLIWIPRGQTRQNTDHRTPGHYYLNVCIMIYNTDPAILEFWGPLKVLMAQVLLWHRNLQSQQILHGLGTIHTFSILLCSGVSCSRGITTPHQPSFRQIGPQSSSTTDVGFAVVPLSDKHCLRAAQSGLIIRCTKSATGSAHTTCHIRAVCRPAQHFGLEPASGSG